MVTLLINRDLTMKETKAMFFVFSDQFEPKKGERTIRFHESVPKEKYPPQVATAMIIDTSTSAFYEGNPQKTLNGVVANLHVDSYVFPRKTVKFNYNLKDPEQSLRLLEADLVNADGENLPVVVLVMQHAKNVNYEFDPELFLKLVEKRQGQKETAYLLSSDCMQEKEYTDQTRPLSPNTENKLRLSVFSNLNNTGGYGLRSSGNVELQNFSSFFKELNIRSENAAKSNAKDTTKNLESNSMEDINDITGENGCNSEGSFMSR